MALDMIKIRQKFDNEYINDIEGAVCSEFESLRLNIRIKNTLELETIWVSRAVYEEIRDRVEEAL